MNTARECNSGLPALHRPASASNPLVVALLYNQNGMATWCWEAAHALNEIGSNVLLIAARDTPLPGTPEVEVVCVDIADKPADPRHAIAKAFSRARSRLSAGPDGALKKIHANLAARGVRPAAYILNQSTFVDRSVPCRQIVAAWSYPVSLFGYLRKTPLLVADRSVKVFFRTALSSLGWWRKDWRGYREADRILPVTEALLASLRRRSISCDLAYPGTYVSPAVDACDNAIRLLMAAVTLGEPRKRILWMLNAMKQMSPPPGTVLQLAGEADESVRRAAGQLGFPVEFLGRLMREELQHVMRQAHIFCFGSLLDDWGYVLVEAMANGLAPVAPATSPFDEILGGTGCCYSPYSQVDFLRALRTIISSPLADTRRQARDRAQSLFSRQAFGRSILASLQSASRPC
jgi:glycosyltransferase involved in cell wall biosynthesis